MGLNGEAGLSLEWGAELRGGHGLSQMQSKSAGP